MAQLVQHSEEKSRQPAYRVLEWLAKPEGQRQELFARFGQVLQGKDKSQKLGVVLLLGHQLQALAARLQAAEAARRDDWAAMSDGTASAPSSAGPSLDAAAALAPFVALASPLLACAARDSAAGPLPTRLTTAAADLLLLVSQHAASLRLAYVFVSLLPALVGLLRLLEAWYREARPIFAPAVAEIRELLSLFLDNSSAATASSRIREALCAEWTLFPRFVLEENPQLRHRAGQEIEDFIGLIADPSRVRIASPSCFFFFFSAIAMPF